MLLARLRSGIVLFTTLILAVFLLSSTAALAVMLFVCALTMWEFYAILDKARLAHSKFAGITGGLLLIAFTWLGYNQRFARFNYDAEILALTLAMLLIFVRQLVVQPPDQGCGLQSMGGTFLGLVYVACLFNFFTRILMAWGPLEGRRLLFYMITVVKITDVGAYFFGTVFGRHKLMPRVSPAKSWEGVAGGMACAVLVSMAFQLHTGGDMGVLRMTYIDAVILGLLLAVTGILGDLFESLLKRSAGVKDAGSLFEGMGGILDLMDSLLLAAPVMYFYSRFFLKNAF